MVTREWIPLIDLRRQIESLQTEMEAAFRRVMQRGRFILGPETEAFEEAWGQWCGVPHVVACASGTAALYIALRSLGVGPGDEVITTPFTFIATIEAILMTGARPIFVDVDAETALMNVDQVEAAITPRTVAVLAVHLYGQVGDMVRLRFVCDRYGLALVEDACQAHGARYRGRMAGTFGEVACFSFYPTKNLSGLGDGGAVVTTDGYLAERCRRIRNHGRTSHTVHLEPGFNFRMSELQAAFLRIKLAWLDTWVRRRNAIVAEYQARVPSHPYFSWVRPLPACEPAWHLAVLRTPFRTALRQWLTSQRIQSAVYYDRPVPLQPSLTSLGISPEEIPKACGWADEVLSVPLFPEMTDEEVQRVAQALASFSPDDVGDCRRGM